MIVFYFASSRPSPRSPSRSRAGVAPQGFEWALLAGVGVAAQLGQVALTHGLRLEPATRATALSYLQVVFAAIAGALVFGDRPGLWTAAGALADPRRQPRRDPRRPPRARPREPAP